MTELGESPGQEEMPFNVVPISEENLLLLERALHDEHDLFVRGCALCLGRNELEAKRIGQKRAVTKMDQEYRNQFEQLIKSLASNGGPFTVEEIIATIGLPAEERTNKNNAVGGLMFAAAEAGLIERVGYVRARRPRSHGRMIMQWKGR